MDHRSRRLGHLVAPIGACVSLAVSIAFLAGGADARPSAPPTLTAGAESAHVDRSALSPARSSVVVQKKGFSKTTSAAGGTFITYGLVLVNRSHRFAARGVLVKVTFADASGGPVASDTRTLTTIPAAGTFYVGGETDTTVPASIVATLEVRIGVKSSQRQRIALPHVRDTSVSKDDVQGWLVSGVMTNPYKKPLSAYDGAVCAVVFDAGGIVLGGYCEDMGEATQADAVAPSATVGVEVSLSDFPDVTAQAAVGRMSVDPGLVALG